MRGRWRGSVQRGQPRRLAAIVVATLFSGGLLRTLIRRSRLRTR